jgi:tetratricopeptide (TPR) repeat protein
VHDLKPALEILISIVHDFAIEDHPFTAFFKENTLYPPLYEESEFALALIYLKMHKENLAHETLLSMFKHYHSAGVQEGYYLARAWIEKGRLSFLKEDFKTALSCFEVAEECGKNYLNEEEKLTLAIFQSHCHRSLQKLDVALHILSKALDDSSASALRNQALILRAEIYELQGKRELAFHQLEKVAQQEGEWGQWARTRLRQNYQSKFNPL